MKQDEKCTIALVSSVTVYGEIDNCREDFSQPKLVESLATSYLKKYLEQKCSFVDAFTVNPLLPPRSIQELADCVLERNPKIVGISLVHQWHRNFAIRYANEIKRREPNIIVILGGVYPTSDWRNLLEKGQGCVDAICLGEGEETLLEFVEAIHFGSDWQSICGIAYSRENGDKVANKRRRRIQDLSSLPFADRKQLSAASSDAVIQIEGSRGCNSSCIFCDIRRTGWVARPAWHIAEEIEQLAFSNSDRRFWFIDNMFIGFGNERFERINQFVSEITSRNLKIQFSFQDRIDSVSDDLIHSLKGIGLNTVYLGIESFSNSALTRWKKKSTAKKNLEALEVLKRQKIFSHIGFLGFDSKTTKSELKDNISGLAAVSERNPYIHLHNFNELIPYSGSYLEGLLLNGEAEDGPSAAGKQQKFVDRFKAFTWTYLHAVWPITGHIFASFDDPDIQPDISKITPVKNSCFVKFLKIAFDNCDTESTPKQILNTVTAGVEELKKSIKQKLNVIEHRTWKAELSAAIDEANPELIEL